MIKSGKSKEPCLCQDVLWVSSFAREHFFEGCFSDRIQLLHARAAAQEGCHCRDQGLIRSILQVREMLQHSLHQDLAVGPAGSIQKSKAELAKLDFSTLNLAVIWRQLQQDYSKGEC